MLALQKRNEHYDSTDYYCEDSCTEDEEEPTSEDLAGTFELALANADLDWRKFILITGQAGTGKSEIFKATIQLCLPQQLNILLAVPTGLLAGTFRNRFGDNITCFSLPCEIGSASNNKLEYIQLWSVIVGRNVNDP